MEKGSYSGRVKVFQEKSASTYRMRYSDNELVSVPLIALSDTIIDERDMDSLLW